MRLKKLKKTKKNNQGADLQREAGSLFKAQGLVSPELEAELLLAAALQKDRVFVLAHPEFPVTPVAAATFHRLVKKRLAGWSSAVLLGHKEFYGLDFIVNRHVLVPRPETEIMVEQAMAELKKQPASLVLDIGTGSGAIIITLAHHFFGQPIPLFYASDKSAAALAVARQNAARQKVKINVLKGDLLRPYLGIFNKQKPERLVIMANLPYLKPEEMAEPSIQKEPRQALISGADGLRHYRRLFHQLRAIPYSFFLIGEINPEQAPVIEKLARASFPQSKFSLVNDYSGRIRFFIIDN